MPFARCPLCDDILNIDAALGLDHPVTCSTCLSNLKIVSLDPCELEEAARRPARPAGSANNPNANRSGSGYYQRGPGGGGPGGRPAGQSGNSSPRPTGSHPGSGSGGAPAGTAGGSTGGPGGSNDRRPPQPPRDRRLVVPPPLALPPNPDKLADVKRPQRWEQRPKDEEVDHDDSDHDELDEFEDKLLRKRGKRSK